MKVSKIISIAIYIMIAVVLIGVLGVLIAYLNNGQRSFYVQSGFEKIYNDRDFAFSETEYSVFYVKQSLGLTDKQAQDVDYSVKVVLNPTTLAEHDFVSYTVDDHLVSLVEIDITEFFDIKQDGNRILFKLPENLDLTKILSAYHGSTSFENVPTVDLYSDAFTLLMITNNADGTAVKLGIVKELSENE